MDYSSSRERRRAAAASRRAARSEHNNNHNTSYANNTNGHNNTHNNGNDTTKLTGNQLHSRIKSKQYTSPSIGQQRQPLEKSFLSSLSRALHTIDQHNNDYFSDNHNHNWNDPSNNNDRTKSVTNNNKNNKHYHKSKSTLKPRPPTNFTSYLHFSKSSIYTLLLFTSTYLLVLYCTFPMVSYSNIDILPTTNNNNDDDTTSNNNNRLYNHYHNDVKPGSSFQRIRGHEQYQHLQSQLGTWKDRAMEWEERAKVRAQLEAREIQEEERYLVDSAVEQLSSSRVREDVRKMNQLLEEVVEEFDEEVEKSLKEREESLGNKGSDEHWNMALKSWDEAVGVDTSDEQQQSSGNGDVNESEDKRPGFIVLGMHRSGTSMLSGLLVEGFGYETGGPLIMPNFDNEKGFYERIDVVLQNDEFFEAQDIDWTYNVINYDSEAALRDKMLGKINFDEGKRALKFLNNHHKTLPYLQKDPRMCIALPTWLKLLDDEPAVVFTYRHPLEVALSLKKRDSGFTLEHGLRLWIIYNMRAIQNSARLCRVFSTNEKVMKDPTREVQRIKNELTDRCHVMPPVKSLMPQSVVDSFIDPNLQHNSKERKNDEKTSRILKDYGNDCIAKEFESDFEEGSSKYRAEREMFLMAMRVFCDFEIGKAYEDDYEWPDLKHWQRPSSNDN